MRRNLARFYVLIAVTMIVTPANAQVTTFLSERSSGNGDLQINSSASFNTCEKLLRASAETKERARQWSIGIFNGALIYGPQKNDPKILKRMNDLDPSVFWKRIEYKCSLKTNSRLIETVQEAMDDMIFPKR